MMNSVVDLMMMMMMMIVIYSFVVVLKEVSCWLIDAFFRSGEIWFCDDGTGKTESNLIMFENNIRKMKRYLDSTRLTHSHCQIHTAYRSTYVPFFLDIMHQ